DAQVLSVNFDLTWPDGTRVFDVPEPTVFGARQASALMRVSRRLVKVAAHVPTGSVKPAWQISLSKVDARTYFAVTAAFQQFLASYAQLSEAAGIPATSFGAANDHFATALRVLDHWPCDRPLELAEVAAAASISVAHLRRIFIDRLGHTPRTHFDRRRLDFAKRLLTDNDAQIKRVAYLVGFDVPAHFTRWFKRHTGQAPRSFRTAPHTAARPTEKPASARTR
ncbi:MAG: helix-turn-helix transcriptional regulator, partial [Planctomycetota bacterium]